MRWLEQASSSSVLPEIRIYGSGQEAKASSRWDTHRAFTFPYPARPFSVFDIPKGQLCPPSVPPRSRGRVSPSHGKKCGLIACQGGWLPGLAKGRGKCCFSPLIRPHSPAGQPDGLSPLTSTQPQGGPAGVTPVSGQDLPPDKVRPGSLTAFQARHQLSQSCSTGKGLGCTSSAPLSLPGGL